jgi:hypothetical protein
VGAGSARAGLGLLRTHLRQNPEAEGRCPPFGAVFTKGERCYLQSKPGALVSRKRFATSGQGKSISSARTPPRKIKGRVRDELSTATTVSVTANFIPPDEYQRPAPALRGAADRYRPSTWSRDPRFTTKARKNPVSGKRDVNHR